VLADFGMARSHTQSTSVRKTASGPFGTLNWMAPEMISDGAVSQAIDVYAFGIIVWEMCSGMIPWAGIPEQTIMFKVTVKGERPTVERGRWPAWACDLMEACWHQDPKKRPTMADVLARLRAVTMPVHKPISGAPAPVADVKPSIPSVAPASLVVGQFCPPSAAAVAQPAPVSSQVEEWFRKGCSFDGVARYEREAVKWFRLAADQGHAEAQCRLAICYRDGSGVKKDQREAVKWFRLAADQGHTSAQFDLAICYRDGSGLAKDEREATKWYRMAADQGHSFAQFSLGVCYQNGTGVAMDEGEAVKWFRLAADQGRSRAQFKLGICYAHGTGVAKDEREAVKWYRLAADQGLPEAAGALRRLEAQ
jgi:TPR repeat protein